jgi:transposase InsO family protein
MITLCRENPRYGYRRIWALLKGEGWQVNKKRVHRLWKEQGLRVPAKQRKRRRLPGVTVRTVAPASEPSIRTTYGVMTL